MTTFRALVATLAVAASPLTALAAPIIDGTTVGRYNNGLGDIFAADGPGGVLVGPGEGDPLIVLGSAPTVAFTPQFGTNWLAGDYTGGTWSAGPVAIPSTWAAFTETAIVYEFSLAATSSLHIDLGVDNGILVWLDGTFLFGATAPGGASISEYDVDVASVASGLHRLQILRADHGGATGYQILADATPVPEPGTVVLSLVALAGFGLRRRHTARLHGRSQ